MNKYWLRLTEREQLLVSGCVAFIIVFMVYVFIISPLSKEKNEALRALEVQKNTYNRVVDMAAQATIEGSSNRFDASENMPIREAATVSARATGIAISRIQPGADNRVTFWVDEANTQDITAWLLLLKNEYHWTVTKITLNKNTNNNTVRGQFEFKGNEV